jgi:hypothetical protein
MVEAPARADARAALERFRQEFDAKYPKAVAKLDKDWTELTSCNRSVGGFRRVVVGDRRGPGHSPVQCRLLAGHRSTILRTPCRLARTRVDSSDASGSPTACWPSTPWSPGPNGLLALLTDAAPWLTALVSLAPPGVSRPPGVVSLDFGVTVSRAAAVVDLPASFVNAALYS